MPIYEYICEDCQTHFEKIVLNKQRRFPARSARASETPYSSPFSAPAMAPQTAHLQSLPGGFRAEAAAAAVVAPVIKSFSHSVFGCHLTCHRALSRSIYSSSLDSWGRSC